MKQQLLIFVLFMFQNQSFCFPFCYNNATIYCQTFTWPRKVLFSTGPGSTDITVKEAMLVDHSYTEQSTKDLYNTLRKQILRAAEVSEMDYEATLLQGSVTFSIEAVINTATPRDGKWLILTNGYFGYHLENITYYSSKDYFNLIFKETELVDPKKVDEHLQTHKDYTGVAVIHLESSTGSVNDVAAIGKVVKKHLPNAFYVVDAATSFSAIPVDFTDIDFFVAAANKALAGVPGIAITIVKKSAKARVTDGRYSYVLSLIRQFEDINRNTMPYESLSALKAALDLLEKEGGVKGRSKIVKKKNDILRKGMKDMGFQTYIHPNISSAIITSYKFPDPAFSLLKFAECLQGYNKYIFNFIRTLEAKTFRLGNIGATTIEDMNSFLADIGKCMKQMGYKLPLKQM